jgi:hypothetical protein
MSFTLATLKTAVQDYLQVDETTFNNNLNTLYRRQRQGFLSLFSCLSSVKM